MRAHQVDRPEHGPSGHRVTLVLQLTDEEMATWGKAASGEMPGVELVLHMWSCPDSDCELTQGKKRRRSRWWPPCCHGIGSAIPGS